MKKRAGSAGAAIHSRGSEHRGGNGRGTYAAWRLRRLELASARHAGVPARALWLAAMVELAAMLAVAWAWGAVVALWATRPLGLADVGTILPFAARILLATSGGAVFGASLAVATARERQLFDYFKAR